MTLRSSASPPLPRVLVQRVADIESLKESPNVELGTVISRVVPCIKVKVLTWNTPMAMADARAIPRDCPWGIFC